MGIFFCYSAKHDAGFTYILLEEPVDAIGAQDIFIQEAALADSIGFCFWGESDPKMVTCKETGGIAEVTQVLFSGNPMLLDAGVLAWQEGCFLDKNTALALFGTSDCYAQSLWLEDKAYRVLGTLSVFHPTLLRSTEQADGTILNRCILAVSAENGKQEASRFLLRWGLQGTTIDFYALWVAVYNSLLILPGLLILKTYGYGVKRFQNGHNLKSGVFLSVLAVLFLLLCKSIRVLPDMIPSRWSDFSFWGTWWEGQWNNLQMVIRTPMGERYLQMLLDMVKSIGSSTAALLLFMWTFRRQTDEDTAD